MLKKEVLIYGIISIVVLLVLNATQYNLVLGASQLEIYLGIAAIALMLVGFFIGFHFFSNKQNKTDEQSALNVQERNNSIGLSKRELEVLELMAKGLSNQEIADRLFVSLATVKSHASNLYEKMDVKRRTQAVQKGIDIGLIATPTFV